MFRASRPHSQYQQLPDSWPTPRDPATVYNPRLSGQSFLLSDFQRSSASYSYSSVPSSDLGWKSTPSTHAAKDSSSLRYSSSLSRWKVGARLAALSALLALLLNVGAAAYALKRWGSAGSSGVLVQLYSGDCRKVENMSVWIHLAINALSTALLSGSNYCMQCLSAPSREEVDKAHAQNKWLDIGVPSVRNLRSISRKKVSLWWLLGISSVPLHLM